MPSRNSPGITAQHMVLSKQLSELATLRRDMQGLYESSQAELQTARADLAAAMAEAERERGQREAIASENAELRRWNTQLAEDLSRLLSELRTMERSVSNGSLGAGGDAEEDDAEEAISAHLRQQRPHPIAMAGSTVDLSLLQQSQMDASNAMVRLTRTQARLQRKQKELRASSDRIAQLHQTAQALSSDLAAATAQIGKLEGRIRKQAELQRSYEQLQAEHAAQKAAFERCSSELARSEEERVALLHGPLAVSEARATELEKRERRMIALLERKARQTAEMAAAVQTLGADSRGRIEETIKLRLLAQRLGATPKELASARRSTAVDAGIASSAASAFERASATSAFERAASAAERPSAAYERTATAPMFASAAGGLADGRTPQYSERRDERQYSERLGAVTGAVTSAASLSTAWLPGLDGVAARSMQGLDEDVYGSGRSSATMATGGRRAGGSAREHASRGGDDGSADGDGVGWHSQGLNSQLSLQEKLKKVRSQFADIRKQVGFD
eukprot:jgi/Chrpa1/13066/Chrysochromulina_OHIO_Genome00004441-RA